MTSIKSDDLEQFDSISKRLKHIIVTLGVKQSHMAEKLGLSPSGLHYILNNDVKFSKNAKKIVEYLNATENLINKETEETSILSSEMSMHKVPVYYSDQLKFHYHSHKKEKIMPNEFVISTLNYENETIGIYMTEMGFIPKFELCDILIFEQTKSFGDGEIMLVYLIKSNRLTIKYGFHADKDIILISFDERPLRVPQDDQNISILGVYRECFKRNRVI